MLQMTMHKFPFLRVLLRKFNLIVYSRTYFFFIYIQLRPKYKNIFVSKNTEIVIEGFPRSANTFAAAAFEFAQGRKMQIARHLHAPAQIIESVRRNLPTIVLLRNPRDAAISLAIREPDISLETALKNYKWFYKNIVDFREGFIVANFEQVTTNFSEIILKLNSKYKISYEFFDHNPGNVKKIFTIVEDMERSSAGGDLNESRVSRPSIKRNNAKRILENKIEVGFCEKLLGECYELYNQFNSYSKS